MKKQKTKMVAVRLPVELHEKVMAEIGKERGAFSAFVRASLELNLLKCGANKYE